MIVRVYERIKREEECLNDMPSQKEKKKELYRHPRASETIAIAGTIQANQLSRSETEVAEYNDLDSDFRRNDRVRLIVF
jgi:hypothetical protein